MFKILILILLTSLRLNAQTKVDSSQHFFVNNMTVTQNYFTEPHNIPNLNHDTLLFYVLTKKSISNLNVAFENTDSISLQYNSNYKKYQKAVIANYSSDTTEIKSLFRGLFIIQEALDSNGNCSPIELYNNWIYCGTNVKRNTKLKPKECINVYFPRYSGRYKTKLRLKLQTTNGIIYSKIFNGSISYRQFKIKPSILKREHIYPTLFENDDLEEINIIIRKYGIKM